MPTTSREQRIRYYRSEGLSLRAIAQRMRLSKYQIEKVLAENNTPPTAPATAALLAPYRKELTEWVQVRRLPTRIIYQRLRDQGVAISESSVRRYIQVLKKPEVYVHVPVVPGQECQIDFGYLGRFQKDGKNIKVWVFCQVLSFSRYAFYKAVTNQTTETFLRCQIEALEFFGGVPATFKIDNLGAGVLKADFYQPLLQQQYAEMAAHYGATVVTCRIARGQDKGIVESGIKYVKNNFLKNLESRDFIQLESRLAHWNKYVCNCREHGTLRELPINLFTLQEKATLRPLPVKRFPLLRYEPRIVNGFGHIYYRYNQYSVPPQYAGESVLLASDSSTLRIFHENEPIAMHLINPKKGKIITEDHHQPLFKRAKTPEYYRQLLEPIGQEAIALLERILPQRPFEWKKMCAGIRRLADRYGHPAVNAACAQALLSPTPEYQLVKKLVEKAASTVIKIDSKRSPITHNTGYAHDLRQYDDFFTPFNE